MIERLLPAYVACADTYETDAPAGSLYPEEARLVAASVDRRRHEFAAVRACARRAMAVLGLPPAPVMTGHRGMPLWPEGTVGSMTHCEGYRAAALARASDVRAVGIDAEPNEPLPPGVWEAISVPAERERLPLGAEGSATPAIHWDRLLFSAKESVFKTWFPLTRIELDFDEAEIEFRTSPGGATEGTFVASLALTAPGMPRSYEGRWLIDDGFAVTAIVLPEAPSA
ncbi:MULTISPECIES: 4'-phosphopantetheinyl transferase family protein [unclassified Streptomyces]|uniref:4'-phosphopantetheinyl transferase family protein n=1 Tax=unclassified Streptomyces TaxID=2593676 RepID=UPI0029A3F3FA|nr:4'-phosphopantetheinyl transferase superfamily protein [Streptomyces sp. AK04-4c]MDX3685607.1 4'-phosphopantetheinyl transferase superfamily protein [Streptomyces sp. AK04-4c]